MQKTKNSTIKMTELGLRARLRNDDSNSTNLFVRLAPWTVVRLHQAMREEDGDFPAVKNSSSIPPVLSSSAAGRSSSSSNARIEFLPLIITNRRSNSTVYASYNGGDTTGKAGGCVCTLSQ